jgi:hypothetical protein
VPRSQLAAALIGLLALLSGQSAAASALSVSIRDGRVTIVASDVTVREILAEWERIGRTAISNLDKLKGPRVTLELHEVPEAAALAVLLRSVGGYVALPRTAPTSTGSVFQSILILPSSSSPAPPVPVTARAPSPGVPLTPAQFPLATRSAPALPSPLPPGDPVALNGGRVVASPANVGSPPSSRFAPVTPVELAGLRRTREQQQEVLFRNNSTQPAGSAPRVSTDASRPGTITTVVPPQNQQPGTPRR